jgi:hypothetical protein
MTPSRKPVPSLGGLYLRMAADHLAELNDDAATLTVAGGDTVQVVCMSAVREWLDGLAVRADAGTLNPDGPP